MYSSTYGDGGEGRNRTEEGAKNALFVASLVILRSVAISALKLAKRLKLKR